MDKFTDIAQNAWGAVLVGVRKLREEGKTLDEIATILQLKNRALVSEWLSGNREAVNAPFPNMLRYLSALNLNIADFIPDTAPTIRRMGAHSPVEIVEGDVLPRIPVVGEAGAGSPVEFFNQTPDTWIQVLPQYMLPNICAYQVTGDSMQPTIMKNSYVGVVPLDGSLAEGSIYLLKDEDFGYMVKRVRKASTGTIMLHSDNKDYEPRPIKNTGYHDIIIGRVVWVWQLM